MENFWKSLGASLRSVMENDSELERALEEEKRLVEGERNAAKPMSIGYALLTGLREGGRGKAFGSSNTSEVGLAFIAGLDSAGRTYDGYEKQALAKHA